MATLEELRKKVESTEQLQSVVKTMKTIAAVSIRQYEKAVQSLGDFNRTIEMGFQILLRNAPMRLKIEKPEIHKPMVAVILGSDQGMCGQFNEQITSHAVNIMSSWEVKRENQLVLAVGERIVPSLEAEGAPPEETFTLPGSISGITPMVQKLLLTLEELRTRRGIDMVYLFHNRPLTGSSYKPGAIRLLPLDPDWLEKLKNREWETRMLPVIKMDWDRLFSVVVRYYLFVSLYQALAESLAAENASRIASMQAAEKNIDEQLDSLNAQYRHERQRSITEELFDIIAGFEALRE